MVSAPSLLLALPDPCLLAVLQCLAADDQRSLFSAARTHSRLQSAAVVALRSIRVNVTRQQQMDNVLLYLAKHGQHVDRMDIHDLKDFRSNLHQLPPNLQLTSLQLHYLGLQLQPGNGSHGVLGAAAAAALKQLRLSDCKLLDGVDQLAAALSQLPAGLEHLSIRTLWDVDDFSIDLPTGVLQRPQQLTYLELAELTVVGPCEDQPALQPLQALTRLQDLRLQDLLGFTSNVTASMLLGTHCLTRLEVSNIHMHVSLEPSVLTGKTQLQHLQLANCVVSGGAAGTAQLLSHLQPLQQLTYLDLRHSEWEGTPPAAAFSAMTASSKLQHLDIRRCNLPAGVWQHVFPADRQLPHLTSLDISLVTQAGSTSTPPAPESSRLVSCCPGMQLLGVIGLQFGTDFLAAMQELRNLHTLRLVAEDTMAADRLHGVCQLTGLRELVVFTPMNSQEQLLQLTQFSQLTALTYSGPFKGDRETITLAAKGPGDESVWRQVLRLHLDHSDPGVAQQAAAALAE